MNSYRKALRMMKYADHHGFPIVTFVDTHGAFADLKSEELGHVCALCDARKLSFLCCKSGSLCSYIMELSLSPVRKLVQLYYGNHPMQLLRGWNGYAEVNT